MYEKYFNKKNNIITGLGATAIYLSLINERIENAEVIVPGNICYAAVYPIMFSGNIPVFCDVEYETGNVYLNEIKNRKTSKTKAILVPHMYGNIVKEIAEIAKWCKDNSIILIEDCASSFGAYLDKEGFVGSFGDYSIFSFGYSKIIDLGDGGILSTNNDVSNIENVIKDLNEVNQDILEEESKFSKTYRCIRNKVAGYSYDKVNEIDFRSLLLYKSNISKLDNFFKNINIDDCVEKHRLNYNLYNSLISKKYKRIEYTDGSVPWRFSILVNHKEEIIPKLLDKHIPVSDWYPNVTQFFSKSKIELNNIDKMEGQIINFPLMISSEEINKLCVEINKVLE